MVRVQLMVDLKKLGQVVLANANLPESPGRGDTIITHPDNPEGGWSCGERMEWKVQARRMQNGHPSVSCWVNYNNEAAKAWQREQIAALEAAQEEAA